MNEDGLSGSSQRGGDGGYGHLLVERSGGIGGLLLVWDLDIDSSEHRDRIGPQVAELPWQGDSSSQSAAAGAEAGSGASPSSQADRYVYAIESRFGLVRFGEAEMPGEFKSLVEQVREIAAPERRRPGAD
ncbi:MULTISPECIES: hypothetical protein [unclassified Brevibacterium]|uniref:hypothetical protein n=1 Tax=unclassified Brevibacterium TaxID=2614124 RepID=UPI0018662755|nr:MULTISPECIES: hypothetical protein [unclassified Brevibacterium]